MKKIVTLVLAAGMLFGAATGASAIDFKAKGQWIFGMGLSDTNYTPKQNGKNITNGDTFQALQRVRLQLEAVASESLSGTVYFEMGDISWGNTKTGGSLGADQMIVEVKRAFIDWMVPNTELKLRMGLQGVTLPNVAGGSSILDDDVAGIVASYKFNDMVTLTGMWIRPYNDNFTGYPTAAGEFPANYLDNVDLFGLMLPVTGNGWKVTPWAMYGVKGQNATYGGPSTEHFIAGTNSINVAYSKLVAPTTANARLNGNAYSTMFFAGLPISITALDPWNFELDLNYGSISNNADYQLTNLYGGRGGKGAENGRQGWLVKGLVEYKLDWGTPGLFAWYASGDDGDLKNGSERMPNLAPCGNFTSFMGDGATGWSIHNPGWSNTGYDQMLTYSGTWGVGVQLKDMSFVENLKHTVRVAYWGGTNSPEMAKYLPAWGATQIGTSSRAGEGFYLTTHDYMVEFNVDSAWKIYDNLEMILELGYMVNGIDQGTWERSFKGERYDKADGYKAALIFNYSF